MVLADLGVNWCWPSLASMGSLQEALHSLLMTLSSGMDLLHLYVAIE